MSAAPSTDAALIYLGLGLVALEAYKGQIALVGRVPQPCMQNSQHRLTPRNISYKKAEIYFLRL